MGLGTLVAQYRGIKVRIALRAFARSLCPPPSVPCRSTRAPGPSPRFSPPAPCPRLPRLSRRPGAERRELRRRERRGLPSSARCTSGGGGGAPGWLPPSLGPPPSLLPPPLPRAAAQSARASLQPAQAASQPALPPPQPRSGPGKEEETPPPPLLPDGARRGGCMRLMLLCCTWRDEPMGEDEGGCPPPPRPAPLAPLLVGPGPAAAPSHRRSDLEPRREPSRSPLLHCTAHRAHVHTWRAGPSPALPSAEKRGASSGEAAVPLARCRKGGPGWRSPPPARPSTRFHFQPTPRASTCPASGRGRDLLPHGGWLQPWRSVLSALTVGGDRGIASGYVQSAPKRSRIPPPSSTLLIRGASLRVPHSFPKQPGDPGPVPCRAHLPGVQRSGRCCPGCCPPPSLPRLLLSCTNEG